MSRKLGTSINEINLNDNIGFLFMLNLVEFKQATIKKTPGTKEVFVLNQSSPVYVKNETLITGDDIVSAEANEDDSIGNNIAIKLTSKGMDLINKVAKDDVFPMLVFFVNEKPIKVIHHVSEIDTPELTAVINEDKDFIISIAELIKSGIGGSSLEGDS
jgi:hypothetical protein